MAKRTPNRKKGNRKKGKKKGGARAYWLVEAEWEQPSRAKFLIALPPSANEEYLPWRVKDIIDAMLQRSNVQAIGPCALTDVRLIDKGADPQSLDLPLWREGTDYVFDWQSCQAELE